MRVLWATQFDYPCLKFRKLHFGIVTMAHCTRSALGNKTAAHARQSANRVSLLVVYLVALGVSSLEGGFTISSRFNHLEFRLGHCLGGMYPMKANFFFVFR